MTANPFTTWDWHTNPGVDVPDDHYDLDVALAAAVVMIDLAVDVTHPDSHLGWRLAEHYLADAWAMARR